jgi:hypothetical protein
MKSPSMSNAYTLNHEQLQTLLADYRDLRGAERAAVDEHLRTCASCAARLADYRAMDRDLAGLRDARPDARLRANFVAAIEAQPGAASAPRPRVSRAPAFIFVAAAAAVLLLVVGTLFALSPGQPESSRSGFGPAAIPAAKSADVGAFVWQTDGVYGYRMLRPAGWKMSEADDQRAYYPPAFPNLYPGLGLHAVNLKARSSFQSGSGGKGDMAARFEESPDLNGWAQSVEKMWRQYDGSPSFVRIAEQSDEVIYMQAFDPPTSLGVTIVALKVVDGQPLVFALGTGGSAYPDLDTLRARGIWDDFLTMLASLQPIPADPANVVPPAPAVEANVTLEPTQEPALASTAALITVTVTAEATRDPATTQVALDIYSGRPNPAWTLTAEQTRRLREMLDLLPEAACDPLELNLGYRGFVVELGQPPELSNEYRLRVYAKQVRWGDPWTSSSATLCHSDAEAVIARFLLASGQPHLSADEYALAEKETHVVDAVPGDWLDYTDEKLGFSFAHPSNWELTQGTGQSRLFHLKQTEPTGPTFPIFYVTVIPAGFTNADVSAYNFWSTDEVAAALAPKVGASGEVNGAAGYNIYTRLPDITMDGLPGVVVENAHVWEGGADTKDRRVLIVSDGTVYMLGTYYATPEELEVFEQVMGTFSFVPPAGVTPDPTAGLMKSR